MSLLSNLASLLQNVKNIIIMGAVIAASYFAYNSYVNKQESIRYKNNLTATSESYRLKDSTLVSKVTELRYTNAELKQISKRDSASLSESEKKLLRARNKLDSLGVKTNNAESIDIDDFSVSNEDMVTTIEYDNESALKRLKPIKNDHLEITFKVSNDTVYVTSKYHATITTVVNRERDKETVTGKTRFFLARLVNPRWKYFAESVIDDKNAKIDSKTYIKFQHNKGKR